MLARLLRRGEPVDILYARLARLLEQPPTAVLVRRASLAAAATVDEDKLRLLGQALRALADDPARFDDEQLLIAAVSDLEAAHLKLLALIAHSPSRAGLARVGEHWLAHELAERSRGRFSPAHVAALLQPLALRGCVATVGTYGGGYGYLLAPLGRQLLARAHAATAEADGPKGAKGAKGQTSDRAQHDSAS